jgi:hypothetical protein
MSDSKDINDRLSRDSGNNLEQRIRDGIKDWDFESVPPQINGATIGDIVPEPSTALLVTMGLVGLAVYARRKRSS